MMYVCVEREGQFGLHLYVCKEMIPYFFASGHWNCESENDCICVALLKLQENQLVIDKTVHGCLHRC